MAEFLHRHGRALRIAAGFLLSFGLASAAMAQDAAPAVDVAPIVSPSDESPALTPVPESPVLAPVVDLPMVETGLQGHDLSPWGMFLAADYVVKSVMIGLLSASIATLIIWVAKSMQLAGARRRAYGALREVLKADSLEGAARAMQNRRGLGVLLVNAATEEMEASRDLAGRVDPAGIKERVSSRLGRIEVAAGRKISQSLGILASVGSVGPFVGLFGTVWGIMNAFVGIAETQTTNLAVVAPGIAEALLATAFGLVAAIPAVVIYNAFARSVTGYRQLLADISAGIERLVSRDLDRLAVAGARHASALAAE
jgi:biopolymer transport protein ExbB